MTFAEVLRDVVTLLEEDDHLIGALAHKVGLVHNIKDTSELRTGLMNMADGIEYAICLEPAINELWLEALNEQ